MEGLQQRWRGDPCGGGRERDHPQPRAFIWSEADLDPDYVSLHRPGTDLRDLSALHLVNIVLTSMGEAAAGDVSVQIQTVDGHDLARAHVRPSSLPVDATVTVDKEGQLQKKTAFYVRLANGTREVTDPAQRQKYIAGRWAASAPRNGVEG